jgi:hypothetical protein
VQSTDRNDQGGLSAPGQKIFFLKAIAIPDCKESREFEQLALRQARASIKRNQHFLTLEALVASAYVEGFVHGFEVFSEMLREGNIKR